jgi:hypothetical protein
MKRFTDAGRQAIKEDNLYAALSLALTIPDICGSLEDPGPGKSQKRYERWFAKWASPKFMGASMHGQPPRVYVSASDCYQLRCSLIHSGSGEIDPKKQDILSEFVFFDKLAGVHLIWIEGNIVNGVTQSSFLQLKADLFSEDMFKSAEEWDDAVAADPKVQAEKAKLLVIRSKGFAMGGVSFG